MRPSPALRQAVDASRHRALGEGHAKVTAFHLLVAILEDPAVGDTVERAGGSVSRLVAFASAELRHVSRPSFLERVASAFAGRPGPVDSFGFRLALRTAKRAARSASQGEVAVVHVLMALSGDARVSLGMREAGLTRLALLRQHCHGSVAPGGGTAAVASATPCEVVIFNDEYTTMETVVDILMKAFEMPETQAIRTMLRVHWKGKATLGPYTAEEAAHKLKIAGQMAEAKEAPLRLVMQATQG